MRQFPRFCARVYARVAAHFPLQVNVWWDGLPELISSKVLE